MVCVKQKEKCLYTLNVFKVTSTLSKVSLIFDLKGIPIEKVPFQKLM